MTKEQAAASPAPPSLAAAQRCPVASCHPVAANSTV